MYNRTMVVSKGRLENTLQVFIPLDISLLAQMGTPTGYEIKDKISTPKGESIIWIIPSNREVAFKELKTFCSQKGYVFEDRTN